MQFAFRNSPLLVCSLRSHCQLFHSQGVVRRKWNYPSVSSGFTPLKVMISSWHKTASFLIILCYCAGFSVHIVPSTSSFYLKHCFFPGRDSDYWDFWGYGCWVFLYLKYVSLQYTTDTACFISWSRVMFKLSRCNSEFYWKIITKSP